MYLWNYALDQPCPVSPSSHQHLCWSRGIKCWATPGVPSCTKRTNQDILSAFPVPCICSLLLPCQSHSQELLDYLPRWQVSLGALPSLAAAGAPDILHIWHNLCSLPVDDHALHGWVHAGHTEDNHPPWARALPCRGQIKNRAWLGPSYAGHYQRYGQVFRYLGSIQQADCVHNLWQPPPAPPLSCCGPL